MNKWMIVEQQFFTSAVVVEKGILDEEEARTKARLWDMESDNYTSYNVQMYQDEQTLNFDEAKIKLK